MLNSDLDYNKLLTHKTALITGASQGIGESIARLFASHGATLVLVARNKEKLDRLALDLSKTVEDILVIPADVSDENELKSVFREVMQKGELDILVNNAGYMEAKPLAFVKRDDISLHFNVNTFSVLQSCQLASRIMARKKQGTIINIASMLGEYGQKGQSVYSASKAAVSGITRSLAQELSDYNIRVNAIAPGIVNTSLINPLTEKEKQYVSEHLALSRLAEPVEIARIGLFLASEMSSYITGQIIHADGGVHF